MQTVLAQHVEARIEHAMKQVKPVVGVSPTPAIDRDLLSQLERRILGQVQWMLSEAETRQLAGVRQMVQKQIQPLVTPVYPTAPQRSDQLQTVLSQMDILAQEMIHRKGEITTLHTGFLSMAQQQEWVTGRLVELEN